MAEGEAESVLRRKAEAGRIRPDEFAMSPRKAFRQALAMAAQDLMEMPLSVPDSSESRVSLSDLPDVLEDRALLAILDGPGESQGLIALSPPVLAGVIEMQTMGRLGVGAVLPRKPTRTDAAMVAEFVDRVLSEAEALLTDRADMTWAGGFRYGSWLEDPRPLGLILEDTSYRLFLMSLDMGLAGTRRGTIVLALPAERRIAPRRDEATADRGTSAAREAEVMAARDWAARIEQAVTRSEVRIDAVLHRIRLPLGEVMTLAPGMVMEIPMDALERLSIEGADGRAVARGRLGQATGQRAVRLTGFVEDEDGRALLLGGTRGRAQRDKDTEALSGRSPFPEPGPGPAPQPILSGEDRVEDVWRSGAPQTTDGAEAEWPELPIKVANGP